jgi:uncharacterized XkdX family phage protein
MDWFTRIKNYYDAGLWSIEWLKNAVVMDKITEAQFKDITGQDYVA